jgi:hypothetical protein
MLACADCPVSVVCDAGEREVSGLSPSAARPLGGCRSDWLAVLRYLVVRGDPDDDDEHYEHQPDDAEHDPGHGHPVAILARLPDADPLRHDSRQS